MDTQTVLILGANGRFGHAATAAFAAAGWHVLAQMRRPPQSPLAANVQVLQTPLQDTEGLVAAARGARTVVYGVNPLYTRWDEEALPLARLGMDLAERLRATFMLPGNVYNFGDQMPAQLRTDTPQRPHTRKGQQRCELEGEIATRSHTLTGGALLQGLEQAATSLGLNPARSWRQSGMPWGVIRAVGTVYPLWRELARMSYLWRVPHALDGRELAALTGPQGTTPVRVALRSALMALGHGASAGSASAAGWAGSAGSRR